MISCLVLAGFFAVGTVEAVPHLERISFTEREDGNGYVIRFHLDAPVAAYSEPRDLGGGRLEVILFNTSLAPAYQGDPATGPVVGYEHEAGSGHVVVRFHLGSPQTVQASAYRDRTSDDLLIGLTHSDGTYAARPGSSPATNPATSPAADPASSRDAGPVRRASISDPRPDAAPPDDIPWEPADRKLASQAGAAADDAARTVSNEPHSEGPVGEGSRWRLNTVVIDAGHGGKDPGAMDNGVREKDVTLGVALKLGSYLEERLGMNVIYTRKDDRFIELRDRGRIANQHGGKLFVSLHVNAASNRSARGAETYFLGMHKSDAARRTMERENAVVELESSQSEYADMTEEALIRMQLTQSAYMQKSEELSELIQDQFENRVQRTNRGVKQAGFYVLWGASMPAVLVELGFLTNPSEAAFLSSDMGQDYLASAVFRAVRAYREQYEKGLGQAAAE